MNAINKAFQSALFQKTKTQEFERKLNRDYGLLKYKVQAITMSWPRLRRLSTIIQELVKADIQKASSPQRFYSNKALCQTANKTANL